MDAEGADMGMEEDKGVGMRAEAEDIEIAEEDLDDAGERSAPEAVAD